MKELNSKEIQSVNGGVVLVLTGLAAVASAAFGAYQAGKVIGKDIAGLAGQRGAPG